MSTNSNGHAKQQGLHVAIIMDGNGRWANGRGLPRVAGHRAGAEALRPIVEAAPQLGITTLTVYAFSSDNWLRPGPEVKALMRLFHAYLLSEAKRCLDNGVRLNIIGRRDRFQPALREVMERVEATTLSGQTLHLRVALDYSSRDAILRAAGKINGTKNISRECFARLLAEVDHAGVAAPDVDLLIRTGGEQRLSDFLLWECAYAELFFIQKMWPEFNPADLEAVIKEFHCRERRFGRAVDLVDTNTSPKNNGKFNGKEINNVAPISRQSGFVASAGRELWSNHPLD